MRGLLIGGLLGAGLLALPGDAAAQHEVGRLALKMGWLTDYEAGREAARRSGKPMFVVFRCQP